MKLLSGLWKGLHRGIALASLLLCTATVLVWARSHWYVDELSVERPRLDCYFVSYPGELFLRFEHRDRPNDPDNSGLHFDPWRVDTPADFPIGVAEEVGPSSPGIMGFDWDCDGFADSEYHPLSMKVPYWALSLLLAIVPAVAGKRAMRRRRIARRLGSGCCVQCGYDLRATPARCPECGAATKTSGV